MLTSLLLLALAAWSVPSVRAAAIQSRQASSNTFSFTVSGNDNCKTIAVSFYDAGYNFIEQSAELSLDKKVRTYSFNQDYTPAFASFRARCPDSAYRYRIHSITSYGLTYDSTSFMYLSGDDGVLYTPGDNIYRHIKTTAMLLNDGRKKDGTLATDHINRFTVSSKSGSGTLDISIRADCAFDDATIKIASLSGANLIAGKTYSLTGFNQYCRQFLIMNWAPAGGSVSIDNNSLVINDLVKPSTTSNVDLQCQNWSQAGAPYATSVSYNPLSSLNADGSLSAGTYYFYCENLRQYNPIGSGSKIQTKVPFML